MGAGKSRVGRALARRLGFRFIDSDDEIEKTAELTIAEIFAREGEAGFRKRERAVLEALPDRRCVVALGGGAVASAENRLVLREKGRLVWLDARPETIVERVGAASERPLLAGLDRAGRLAKLAELREARRAAYATAEIRIETDALGADEVCAAILDALGDGAAT